MNNVEPIVFNCIQCKESKELKEDVNWLLEGWKGKSVDHSFKELKDIIQKNIETSKKNLILDKQDIEIICKYVIYRCKKENLKGVLVNNGIENDILCYKNDESSSSHSPSKEIVNTKHYSIYNLGGIIGKGSDGVVRFAQKLTEEATPSILAVKYRESYHKSFVSKSVEDEYRILQYIRFAKDYCKLSKHSHYIFMEYFPGCPVSEMAKDWHDDIRSGVATGCLEAVDYLYTAGIYHCDIKPENFLITLPDTRNWLEVKLIDYGSSIIIGDKKDTIRTLGTPSYMAPECFDKNLSFDREKSEVYSLCITLFEVLSRCLWRDYQLNKPPFSVVTFQDIQKACPDVFLSNDELIKLKINDRWKFELLGMCYWMYKEDSKDRPSFYDLKNVIHRIAKLRDDYIFFSFPGNKTKSKSSNTSPRNTEEKSTSTHAHHRSPRLIRRHPFSKSRNAVTLPTINEPLEIIGDEKETRDVIYKEKKKKHNSQASSY